MSYCINKLICQCRACGADFEEYVPTGYELVQFRCGDGKRRYLPVYGKGGYLDLLARLVHQWTPEQTITKTASERLCKRLSELCAYPVELSGRSDIQCPHCGTKDISICKGDIISDFPVEWLKVSEEL